MSSNKVKRGWKQTYEKNDNDNWKREQREIMTGSKDLSKKPASHPQQTGKKPKQ